MFDLDNKKTSKFEISMYALKLKPGQWVTIDCLRSESEMQSLRKSINRVIKAGDLPLKVKQRDELLQVHRTD
jgi:hypothetical protein